MTGFHIIYTYTHRYYISKEKENIYVFGEASASSFFIGYQSVLLPFIAYRVTVP